MYHENGSKLTKYK